jgi:hypothetical protein
VHQWCEFKSRRGKNKNLTAQKSNSSTVWFNFQTYILFSIDLVSQVSFRSSGTDILYGCHLLRCLYNILYFLWLYNEFFIILCNILKNIAELDCCQIIILSIYYTSWILIRIYSLSIGYALSCDFILFPTVLPLNLPKKSLFITWSYTDL